MKKILSLIGKIAFVVFVLVTLFLAYLFDPYYPIVVIATFIAMKLILKKL